MKTTRAKVTPFLWFESGAEEAARFYCSLFADSKVTHADPMSVTFTLAGREFMGLNGGPHYRQTPAYSMFVTCEDQAEVDSLWEKLVSGGGKPSMCGWLVDRYGVSWQVIPKRLEELLHDPDAGRRERATQAMLKMQRIDVAALERAAAGT